VCERDLASAGCLVSVDRNTIAMSLRQMDTLHIHEQGALHAGIALRLTRDKLLTRIQKEMGMGQNILISLTSFYLMFYLCPKYRCPKYIVK